MQANQAATVVLLDAFSPMLTTTTLTHDWISLVHTLHYSPNAACNKSSAAAFLRCRRAAAAPAAREGSARGDGVGVWGCAGSPALALPATSVAVGPPPLLSLSLSLAALAALAVWLGLPGEVDPPAWEASAPPAVS